MLKMYSLRNLIKLRREYFPDGKNMLTCESEVTLDTSAAATCDRLLQCGHQPPQLNFRSESYSPTYSGEQTSVSASVVRTAET